MSYGYVFNLTGASIGSFPVSDWFLFFSLFVYCFCILDQLDAAVKLIRATEFVSFLTNSQIDYCMRLIIRKSEWPRGNFTMPRGLKL